MNHERPEYILEKDEAQYPRRFHEIISPDRKL